MMAAWFSTPDVQALVEKHFVPVRVRCKAWDFDLDFADDPLALLGTTLDEVGAPALVVAKPDGTLVHAFGRIGVFAPEVAPPILRAALARAGVRGVAAPPSAPGVPPADAVAYAEELGVHLDQWTKGAPIELAPLARTTEVDATKQPIDAILGRAVTVLLALQSADGGWHDPASDVRTIAGPGTQYDLTVPRTAIVADALIALRPRLAGRAGELESAARRGIERVGAYADAPEPWVWHATYALHLQVALLRSDLEPAKAKARERAAKLVRTLLSIQPDGGWSYMPAPRTHSFNPALVLLLLCEARELGVEVPDDALAKARAFLASVRNPDDARDSWYAPAMKFEPRASSCRTALCELALVEAGDAGAARRLSPAVAFFFDEEPGAREVTKIYESFLSPKSLQDAYHYYFGHYYVARALARLPKDLAQRLAQRQTAILARQVEADGSFVDAQAQGKSYSTAMAVLTLVADARHARREVRPGQRCSRRCSISRTSSRATDCSPSMKIAS